MSQREWLRCIGFWAVVWMGCCAGSQALAANWEICDLQLQVNRTQPSRAVLHTQVLKAQPQGHAECPQPGESLKFRPETADYQSELPRRLWPQPSQKVMVRYRYLDGFCKERGACRIQHYSPVLR